MAAGGGGDAVGALLARRALGDTDERPPLVTTCAWERLRIDPVPGPRARSDFKDLGLVGGEPCEVLPSSDTALSGRSVLPRLAETSGVRIFLHDFEGGAEGLTGQLQRLATSLDVDKLVVVDVRGDIVARGPEPDLRSPLADSLTLAAALETGIPTSVVVLGPGVDAELPEAEVVRLLEEVGATEVGRITTEDVRRSEPILAWHPTEATALVAAGAEGVRGSVAMRRGSNLVPITQRTPEVWAVHGPTLEAFPLAQVLQGAKTLSQVEASMRRAAINEIDFERKIAGGHRIGRPLTSLPRVISDMKAAGATHITSRRLAEAVGARELDQAVVLVQEPGGLWSLDALETSADRNRHES